MRCNRSSFPPSPPFATYSNCPYSPPSSRSSNPPSSPTCPSPARISCALNIPESESDQVSESILSDCIRPYAYTGTEFVLDKSLCHHLLARLNRLPHCDPLYNLKYTYHGDTSTLITKCAPSPAHDAFHPFFADCIQTMIYERHLSPAQTCAFKVTAGTDVRNFSGTYSGSLKRADVLVTPRIPEEEEHDMYDTDDDMDDDVAQTLPNGGFPTVAVEVGFSESYEGLMRDMRLWLEGSDEKVRVVIIVNLVETPPVNLQPLVHDFTPWRGPGKRLVYESRFGPVSYRSHRVVGTITGTLELWRLDKVTKLPFVELRRTVLPPSNTPMQPDNFTLSMLDLFGTPDRVPPQCEPTERIPFPLEAYRREIGAAVKTLVGHRLDDVKVQKANLEGDNLRDRNWEE